MVLFSWPDVLLSPFKGLLVSSTNRITQAASLSIAFTGILGHYLADGLNGKLKGNDNNAGVALFFHRLLNALRDCFMTVDCEDLWLASKVDMIVGFTASSLKEKIAGGRLDAGEAINKLKHLEAEKLLYILAKWISELRILDNHGQSNIDFNGEVRGTLFNKIIDIWPPTGSRARLIKDLLIKCGGLGHGNWACSTTNELFVPLMQRKKISIEMFWEAAKELCNEHLDDKVYFSNGDSLNIFEVFGWTSAQIQEREMENYSEELGQDIKKALGNIQKPFSASISYENYSNALTKMHKILIVCACVSKYGDSKKIRSLASDVCHELNIRQLLYRTPNSQLNEYTQLYLKEQINS